MENTTEEIKATDNNNELAWDPNEYAKRKAQRNEKKPAEWVVNPQTGERFYLRRVGGLGLAVSGQLRHALTNRAVESWKDKGVNVGEPDGNAKAVDVEEAERDGRKNIELATRIVLEACVVPKVGFGEGEIDPALLDDADLLFICDWATTPAGTVPMKGGEAVSVESLENFPGKPGRRSRTRAGR